MPILAGEDPASGEFVGDEAVPECGIVGVDGQRRADQVCVLPITLCQ
jgi:hypothetical protein